MRVHQPWKTQDKERSRFPVCTAHALSRGQRKRQEEPYCPMRLVSITPCVVQSKRSTRICRARSANSTQVGLGHRVSRVRVLRQYVLPAPGEKSSSHSRARLRRDSGRWDLPEPGCSSPGARLPDHLFSRLVDTLHSFGFPI